MNVEVKIDEKYQTPKIEIYTNKLTNELSNMIDTLYTISNQKLKVYKDYKVYFLAQKDIESIYSEDGKIYVRCNEELYITKERLYELETILDKAIFTRISNSEIANFDKVKNIDFKIVGTMILNFKSGRKTYVSRRYIPKIKELLNL